MVHALKATENLEALLLGERDRILLVGCESEAEVPSSHDVLGRRVNGWLDLVLSSLWTRARARVQAPQLSEQLPLFKYLDAAPHRGPVQVAHKLLVDPAPAEMMGQMTVEDNSYTPSDEMPDTRSEVIEGDCVTGMERSLRPRSVSVIVTSPPYNIGKAYNRHDDSQKPSAYLKWMEEVATACERVLEPNGSFFLNLGGKPSDPGWPFRVVDRFLGEERFRLQNTILWVKSIVIDGGLEGGGATIRGHYKPVNSPRFLSGMAEYVFHLTKRGDVPLAKMKVGTPYKDKSNVARWRDETSDLRDRGNVWFIPYKTVHSERPHPCVFPPKLPQMCILLHGIEKTNLVLDPFAGTGSTGIACTELGVPFVGFDIDPYYVALARSNLEETWTNIDEQKRLKKERGLEQRVVV